MDKKIKKLKILPTKVVDSGRKTQRGSSIINVMFELPGVEMEQRAATFSQTHAEALEKRIGEETEVELEVGEYNGMPSYTIKSVEGIVKSGFKKGPGFQKDVVSIERQKSADLAVRLIESQTTKSKTGTDTKTIKKDFKDLADYIFVWISARPSESDASGGKTEQKTKTDDEPPISDSDIPPEFR